MDAPHSPLRWGDVDLPAPGERTELSFGPLRILLRRVENELWISHRRLDDAAAADPVRDDPASDDPASDDPAWNRWALRGDATRLRVTPALPGTLLVVKVAQPFTLLSGASARIYTRVPASIRVQVVGEAGATDLTEIALERLSDTWWGDFRSGEPGLWLATRARRSLDESRLEPWQIVCTLQLSNTSPDDLPVEKLALRVQYLALHASGERLWAEEVEVEYLGEDEGSEIRMTGRAPREADGATEIAAARSRSRGFRARTFAKLRSFTPFGIGG